MRKNRQSYFLLKTEENNKKLEVEVKGFAAIIASFKLPDVLGACRDQRETKCAIGKIIALGLKILSALTQHNYYLGYCLWILRNVRCMDYQT